MANQADGPVCFLQALSVLGKHVAGFARKASVVKAKVDGGKRARRSACGLGWPADATAFEAVFVLSTIIIGLALWWSALARKTDQARSAFGVIGTRTATVSDTLLSRRTLSLRRAVVCNGTALAGVAFKAWFAVVRCPALLALTLDAELALLAVFVRFAAGVIRLTARKGQPSGN